MTNAAPAAGVVAVGASAGGVEALMDLLAGLASDSPWAVLVALHMPPSAPSVLDKVLDRRSPLPVTAARAGEPIMAGHVYVAVPNRHLVAHDRKAWTADGPTESGHRPAINALFRSVAQEYGPWSIGVLLSGLLDDGVAGLAAIRDRGGVAVVQEPTDALFDSLPQNAIDAGLADHQVSAAEMGGLLKQLVGRQQNQQQAEIKPDVRLELETRIAMGASYDSEQLGAPAGYTCPDCNGPLHQTGQNSFRCLVGHAWTAQALLRGRDAEIERALWVALRSLQEKAKLARRMANSLGEGHTACRYRAVADEAELSINLLAERLAQPADA